MTVTTVRQRPIRSTITLEGSLSEKLASHPASGLSQTAYDLLRVGAWALVIVGGLLVIVGLIRVAQARGPGQ